MRTVYPLKTTYAPLDQLAVFCLLWGMANLFHLLSFPYVVSLSDPFSWLVGVFALLLVLRPQSLVLLFLMLCFSLTRTFRWMPDTPNHILFEFVLNSTILLVILYACFSSFNKNRKIPDLDDPALRAQIFNAFAAPARISLLLLYFYAVLHKLNWDYLNTDISCSSVLLTTFGDRLPFLPTNQTAQIGAIYGTLLIEAAIPLMFCFRRTRAAGIFLGLGFHFFLSLHPHDGLYSFSSLLFSLFFLFTPPAFTANLNNLLQPIHDKIKRPFRLFLKVLLLIAAAAILVRWAGAINFAGLLIWCVYGAFVIVVYTVLTVKWPAKESSFSYYFAIRPAALWVFPALVLFNGMNPYLGFKTQTSFSMFSNLRTEGGYSNHLFIPTNLHLTNLQEDLIEIVETDLEELRLYKEKEQYITFFELRRIVSANLNEDFHVDFLRDGQLQQLSVQNGVASQPDLAYPHNYLTSKFVRFRPIDKGACLCKH
ncbi:HTTM domain-containing protein [Pontibacter sp. 13R65]|uniref:HTTM domain-containing protein n=1 Tax=Pontibacter sp. 13R65 TaxID=3127458 RepID=UPI00301D970A